MMERGRGVIVNLSSIAARNGGGPGATVYGGAKAMISAMTKGLAKELAPRGVRVNAVAPTYIATPLNAFADREGDMYKRWIDGTPMGRLGEPEEVAAIVLFLASDASSLMTGSIVLADGGYSVW
jgi:NAD(P)-dependent dehydrogenase (short-subunit alcohol dehydrogenase family)